MGLWLLILDACASDPVVTVVQDEVSVRPGPCHGLTDAEHFDFPVGAPDARGYFDAQPFGTNRHLGSDWNAVTGGDSDLGAPVFAVARGRVTEVHDHGGGWGRVVRLVHRHEGRCVESLYAHLSSVDVAVGQPVARGTQLGGIGNVGGRYLAHLHFEIRTSAGLPLGGGYGVPEGHVDPTAFIEAHR
ncbi:MAG: M23 family metallopeptidase [Myxococcota bacterium]